MNIVYIPANIQTCSVNATTCSICGKSGGEMISEGPSTGRMLHADCVTDPFAENDDKCFRCKWRRADPDHSTPGNPYCGKCYEGAGY